MKQCFVPDFIIVVTMSLLLGLGCSGVPQEDNNSQQTQVDETHADWVRVDVGLSTAHPYEGNQLESWELEAPEQARGIRVHFNEFETEANQDYFIFGEHIYHGELGNFTTDVAPGHLAEVQFSTDSSNNRYGYDIDYYEYLMPHTALRNHGIASRNSSFKNAKQELKLGLPHPTHPQFRAPLVPSASSFDESHYEELIEHDLVYRCWAYISPGISLPQPLTFTIEPTSLFTLQMIHELQSSYPPQLAGAHIFNGKSMKMKMNFKNVSMGTHMESKVMRKRPLKMQQKALRINTKAIKGGFGTWSMTQFNQPHQHAKTAPRNMQNKMTTFKLKKMGAKPMRLNGSNSNGTRSFQIKNIKI